ncbi:TetR/AcrR family transcriptional regulator [Myceligenerans indicum]|uniref:TetR/AcrR family transcriptional regulator n=1 Tax=Myceligenerans indicum TaxID=2593663 RepID=UPI00191D36E6|nr:TetR/AcrR family transcriptional regulator [Myceligenerans indicum]
MRERNKRARRGAIIDAAQRLVREHGYDAVTTGQIAAEAGVSPRTFFNYFGSKDEAVVGIRTDVGLDPDASRAFAEGGPSGYLLTDLGALLGGMLDQLGDEPARVRAAVDLVRREPRLLQHHQDAVERHRNELLALLEERRGAAPFAADAETVLAAAGAVMQATTLAWLRSGGGHGVQVHLPQAIGELRTILCQEAPDGGQAPDVTEPTSQRADPAARTDIVAG